MECFLITGVESTFRVAEGMMAIEVPGTKRFLEEERIKREKESVLLSVGEERIGAE